MRSSSPVERIVRRLLEICSTRPDYAHQCCRMSVITNVVGLQGLRDDTLNRTGPDPQLLAYLENPHALIT